MHNGGYQGDGKNDEHFRLGDLAKAFEGGPLEGADHNHKHDTNQRSDWYLDNNGAANDNK